MKIKYSKQIDNKIYDTRSIINRYAPVSAELTNLINFYSVGPKNQAEVDNLFKIAEDIKEEIIKTNKKILKNYVEHFEVENIVLEEILDRTISEIMSGYKQEEYESFSDIVWLHSKLFITDIINENPYLKNISFKDKKIDTFDIEYEKYNAFELFMYDTPAVVDNIIIPRIGCFDKDFVYPLLRIKGSNHVWMSITPNEITTMQKPIEEAKGNVLTLGCGLGYFAYMASLKDCVKTVTIIEKDKNVIDMFNEIILPQFENKNKIVVIEADAIEYMRNLEDAKFDYCFADIWYGADDIETYFKIKETSKKFKKMKMSYWIEDTFLLILKDYVWNEIYKECNPAAFMNMHFLLSSLNGDSGRKQKYIIKLLENEYITCPQSIDRLLDINILLKLINETNIIY